QYHHALPSVPTRRSSDLAVVVDADRVGDRVAGGAHDNAGALERAAVVEPRRVGVEGEEHVAQEEQLAAAELTSDHPVATADSERSEEHTSELQSRGQLVC